MANLASNQSWFDSEMANELRSIFYSQFQSQKGALDFLGGKMRAMIANPTGYSPAALNALRTTSTDTLSNQFQNAQKALQAKEFSQGGRDLPSGVNAQLDAGLFSQEASQKAAAQNNITVANEDLKQQNYWKALGVLGGVAGARDPQSYLSGSLGASSGVGPLVNAATAVNQSGFGAQLEGSIANNLGKWVAPPVPTA